MGLSFMGRNWDHGVPGAPFGVRVYRVPKPGAHLVAFGGSRTYHRMACAIEDAGFEIRDLRLGFQGFQSRMTSAQLTVAGCRGSIRPSCGNRRKAWTSLGVKSGDDLGPQKIVDGKNLHEHQNPSWKRGLPTSPGRNATEDARERIRQSGMGLMAEEAVAMGSPPRGGRCWGTAVKPLNRDGC